MAYPNTSAQDLAEKQAEIDQLRALVREYYSAAQIGASMEDPTPEESMDYLQRMLNLIQKTEELLPDLAGEEASLEDVDVDDETAAIERLGDQAYYII